jgi:aminoglycoside phosphotransferase (APT) family kinase protein
MTLPDIDAFAGVKAVEARFALDAARLSAWMGQNVQGFDGPLTVAQFKGGQSNPTYQLSTPGAVYVLRRKPPGVLLPSAHAVDREFRVISALHGAGFPVARPYALCTDDAVIGSMFYIMAKVDGRILWDGALPGLTPGQRREIYMAQVATLAQLHSLDYAAIGLGDYGRPGNYFARQVDRWTRQYKASETVSIPEMDALIEWLPRTLPQDDQTSIVHGDFRLDNMILHSVEPRVLAVLDWELSTLGSPLADITYFLTNWVAPKGAGAGRAAFGHLDAAALGIPSVEETAAEYCRLTGRAGLPALDWYFAYNLFRLAAIFQGIAGRVRDGTAASSQASDYGARAGAAGRAAWAFAKKAGA